MNVFAQAIVQRRLLEFYYEGLPRVVMPAVFGYTTSGAASLRAYQVAGGTHSTAGSPWRLFSVGKAVSVRLSSQTFATHPPGYRPRDRAFVSVIARL